MRLESETNILEALIHPSMPPEQISLRKGEIEEMETRLDELEQDSEKVIDATTQFLGSIVQDEHLEKMIAQLQEADKQLEH